MLISHLLSNETSVGKGTLGRRGGAAFRVDSQGVQLAVNRERTIRLGCGVQGKVARTGSLGGRVSELG